MCVEIILEDLPKHSLNEIYAGKHWTKRNAIKNAYKLIIKSQYKHTFKSDSIYNVSYEFNFKSKPLDTSNTVYMLKMIEDIIFEDDTYKIIPELSIKSIKSDKDFIRITVNKKGN